MNKARDKAAKKTRPGARVRFRHAVCGDVQIDFNRESEFKLTLEIDSAPSIFKRDIADRLWSAFLLKQQEIWHEQFGIPFLEFTDGLHGVTPPASEEKPKRERIFQTIESDHPDNIEIRAEGLITMIKIGNGANENAPIIRRDEIRMEQEFPGRLGFSRIPGSNGRLLSRLFKVKSKRFVGAYTESYRKKSTIPVMFCWEGRKVVVEYEQAKDIGVAQSIAGHKRDIIEFEGEVKKIYPLEDYLANNKVDIKKSPDYISWNVDNIDQLCDAFLIDQRRRLLDFSDDWIQENNIQNTRVVPVYISKSRPEIDALHQILATNKKHVSKAIKEAYDLGTKFAVNKILSALRL